MSTTYKFDFDAFTRAVQERDAATQAAMYAPDAAVTVIDRNTQPRAPRELQGIDEVRAWIEEVCGRDMTHRVQHTVADEHGAAFTLACRYPDGTNVACATVLELTDGQVARQTVVQVWDE